MTNDAEIQPALTREEWLAVLSDPYWYEYQGPQHGGSSQPHITSRHGKAATALYGQPFGFTRDMVDAMDTALEWLPGVVEMDATREHLEALRARIAALLPPI